MMPPGGCWSHHSHHYIVLKKKSVSNPQIFVTNKMGPDDRNDIITIWGNIPVRKKKGFWSKIMKKIFEE